MAPGGNFPSRPQDHGFEEVLVHGGGGVGQTPDHWGNDYFDDVYLHNGHPEPFEGYCTDVWFDAALRFIESSRDRPFFCYLATNAPHGPYHVAPRYARPYHDRGVPSPRAEFYGMIANIDENVARLRRRLEELGLAQDTLLIFTTDNGTAAGAQEGGFNAGLRGQKGAEYEGGHRVPCFFHWPAGGLTGGRDVPQLTAHIDLLPTLADLCGLPRPEGVRLDGTSLVPLLMPGDGRRRAETDENGRTLLVHSQRVEQPQKWRKCAVMRGPWRLVNGRELYDLRRDPGQRRDIAAEQPELVAELRQAYQSWWNDLSADFDEPCRIVLGSPVADPVELTCHDWHTDESQVPWNQTMVARDPQANGAWAVDVMRGGRYDITLRLRPNGVDHPLPPGMARVAVGEVEVGRPVRKGVSAVTVPVTLPAGPATLQTWLDGHDGTSRGAYFVEVRWIGE